jgi:ubiquinol-cytochrome c reductase iron-sulfur subunit
LPPRGVLAAGGGAVLLLAGAVALAVLGVELRWVAAVAAVAVGVLGGAAVGWAKVLAPGEPDQEERHVRGPGLGRRVLITRVGVGAAVALGVALAVPAARRLGPAEDALRTTAWQAGSRVVTSTGELVRADEVALGDLLTVYPEGAVGAHDAQLVLVRELPERIEAMAGRAGWSPEGLLAYSKLCTHMGCPVGLYQQRTGELLCPCHQAVFDVLRGGEAVEGPARRPLPQLPLAITADGHLAATGELSGPVGTGFWGRP